MIGAITERVVGVSGARRAFLEAGAGSPVVLLHGIGSRAFSWSGPLTRWSSGRRVIAWDAPGYGSSDDFSASSPSVDTYVDALAGLLDVLEIERIDLLGHSLGALIGGTFAATHPQRVRRLVLLSVACGYGHLPPQEREALFESRSRDLVALGPEALARKRTSAILTPGASPAAFDAVREAMSKVRISGYLAALRMLIGADLFSRLTAVTAPTLVACGAQDTVTTPDQNRRVASSIRGARFATVERAGHAVYVERPNEVDALVVPFLDGAVAEGA